MLAIQKVVGDSMSPQYQEGDFVVITTVPFFLRRIRSGDVIIFDHSYYGRLIKRVQGFTPTGEVYVSGTQENSLDSRRLGPIRRDKIKGKVILHISKPSN
jgi:signal peptidase I